MLIGVKYYIPVLFVAVGYAGSECLLNTKVSSLINLVNGTIVVEP